MFEVFLKSPGIIFVKTNGSVVRTPIKFLIKKSEKQLYESLIRISSITNFTIEEIDVPNQVDKKKVDKLSIIKPKIGINMDLKIQN